MANEYNTEYTIKLYLRYSEDTITTNFTISGQCLTMEQAAIEIHKLLMVGGYDKHYEGFDVFDPSFNHNIRNLYMDLVE